MSDVALDTASPVPHFEQIRAQIAVAVRSGALPSGTRLPTIRQLAADLAVAPGTVARAYRELEADGLVVPDGRRGTRVATQPMARPTSIEERAGTAARRFLEEAAGLGLTPQDALTVVARLVETRAVRSA